MNRLVGFGLCVALFYGCSFAWKTIDARDAKELRSQLTTSEGKAVALNKQIEMLLAQIDSLQTQKIHYQDMLIGAGIIEIVEEEKENAEDEAVAVEGKEKEKIE